MSNKKLIDCKKGDFIEVIKVTFRNKHLFTVGKKYEVISKNDSIVFEDQILTENGLVKGMVKCNNYNYLRIRADNGKIRQINPYKTVYNFWKVVSEKQKSNINLKNKIMITKEKSIALPTIYLTREVFNDLLQIQAYKHKKDVKFLKNVNKYFGESYIEVRDIPQDYELNLLKMCIPKHFNLPNDFFKYAINQINAGEKMFVNIANDGYGGEKLSKDQIAIKNFDELYDYLFSDFVETKISNMYLKELIYLFDEFEKCGSVISGYDRILNEKEIALAELIGFNHDIVCGPRDEEDEVPNISVISMNND